MAVNIIYDYEANFSGSGTTTVSQATSGYTLNATIAGINSGLLYDSFYAIVWNPADDSESGTSDNDGNDNSLYTDYVDKTDTVTFSIAPISGTNYQFTLGSLVLVDTDSSYDTVVVLTGYDANGAKGSIEITLTKYINTGNNATPITVDVAGNVNAAYFQNITSYTLTLKTPGIESGFYVGVDNVALTNITPVVTGPAAPSTPDMTAGTDSGSSSTDNITNDTTPTFTGTSDASVTVNLYDTDGTTLLGTTTADGSGNWSITTSALSAGVHSITAKANNGSTDSAASAALSVTIDTTAPTATITMADTALKAGDTSLVTITFSEDVTGFSNADLTIANGTLSAVSTSDGGTTWTATFTPSVMTSDTTNVITLDNTAVTDVAGNAALGTTDSANYVVETNSPTDIALSNATASTAGGANVVVGSLSSTDATVGDTFTYSLVAGTGDTDNASFNINGSDLRVTNPSGMSAGTYSVLVRTTDAAGNMFDEAQSITISTNPTVTISADDTSLKSGQTATVTFTFSEAPTGFDDSDITVSGGTLSAVSSSSATVYTATYTPDATTQSISETISIGAAAFTGSGNNSLASNTLTITGDTLAPTVVSIDRQTPASATTNADTLVYRVTFSEAVSGVGTADFSVSGTTATVTGVASAGGNAYDVTVSGGDAASYDGAVTLSFAGGQDIADSAGNALTATTPTGTNNATYTLDNTAPTFTSAATNSAGTKVILTYDGALSATTAATTDFTVEVGGQSVTVDSVTVSGSTVELTLHTAVTNGQAVTVAYTDPTGGNDANAVQDSAGNDAADLTTTTVTNSVPAPSSGGGGTTTPPTTTNIIGDNTLDGIVRTPTTTTTLGDATVTTQTGTGTRTFTTTDGNTVTQTNKTVEAVQITAPTGSTTATTSVPLYWGESSKTEWATTASVSSGVTLASEGNRAPTTTQTKATAIDDLIYYIQTTVSSTDSTKSEMLGGGSSFLTHLSNVDTLVVNKVVLSTTSASSTAPATVSLDGTATAVTTNGVTDTPKEALVIDGSSLSSGSTVSLSNIEFGVLTGSGLNVVMTGTATQTVYTGTGTQTLTTSSLTQNQLYAGAGDDAFHITAPSANPLAAPRAEAINSLSTSDTFAGSIANKTALYGEDGNDTSTVEGTGTQNAFVHGGSGADSISYQGSINDYTITRDNGITYVHSNSTSKTDVLLNIESIQFSDETYTITNNNDLTQIASLYQQVLGRQAEVDGFQYWASTFDNGDTIGAIATSFVRSSEYFNNTSNVWDAMSNDQKIETFYELMLGRASDAVGKAYWMDAINNGMSIEDIAGSFVESAEMQGICPAAQEWNFTI